MSAQGEGAYHVPLIVVEHYGGLYEVLQGGAHLVEREVRLIRERKYHLRQPDLDPNPSLPRSAGKIVPLKNVCLREVTCRSRADGKAIGRTPQLPWHWT